MSCGRAGNGLGHDLGQAQGGEDRRLLPRLADESGDAARAMLFAIEIDQIGQIRLFQFVDEIGGAAAGARHAHIQGAVEAEREAAFGLVELHGGHADIQGDPVEFFAGRRLLHLGKPGFHQF